MRKKLMRRLILLTIIAAGVLLGIYYFSGPVPRIPTGQITTTTKAALTLSYSDLWFDSTSEFNCTNMQVDPVFQRVDCLLLLVDPRDRTNINILRYETAQTFTIDMIQALFATSAGEIVASEVIEVSGTPAVLAEMEIAPSGYHVRQMSTFFDGGLYVITAWAQDRATFDAHRSEIDEVLSSVQLRG